MKKGFLKSNKIFKINLLYILSLIPVIGFAYYKNGYLVAKNGFMPFYVSLQYIIIPIVILLLSYVFETYYYTVIKKEEDLHSVYNSIAPYALVLCYLVCAPMHKLYITIPLMVIVDVLLKFVDNKLALNQVALFKCILFGVMFALGVKGFENLYEATIDAVEAPKQLFLGMGVGEIGVTSTLCALIGFIILAFNSYYKKDVPIVVVLGYAIVAVLLYFVGKVTFNDLLVNTFSSGFAFIAIYVASISNATPVVRSGRVVYSLLVGIAACIFINVVHFNLGVYITILVLSLLNPLFNKFKLSMD
jgi:Na+-translocating ferredoxin:NAD+ oxidoreductase RnfD subunit